MILLDKPYVSEFLKQTIVSNHIPVINTQAVKQFGLNGEAYLLDENAAVQQVKASGDPIIYATSENSIGWIAENLAFTDLPEKVNLFKDKAKFRTLIKSMYPEFYYREVKLDELPALSLNGIPTPFIIKPNVGFFSMGVHKVSSPEDWEHVVKTIHSEMRSVENLYPLEVMNSASFIIEECIEGDEFAVDAYFNDEGEPVILNILHHVFSSGEDVSDRVYISSKKTIEENIKQFQTFLGDIGSLAGVRNFPMHVEIRRTADGSIVPIEINPMRFGGWCSTPDLTWFAYGLNSYEYYFSRKRPDWDEILKGKNGRLFSIVVLDNSTGVDGSRIASFDYERLTACFEKPLELRKIDYTEYPVFAFLFTETREENYAELERILKSDLKEFITEKV